MGFFGSDIVGGTLAVHYPEPVPSLFHVRVVSYSSRTGWHSVRAEVQGGAGRTWDFLGGRWEEEFVDVLNVNLYWEQGLVYFVGDLNQAQCAICRLPATPRALCAVQCGRCHQNFHSRCVDEKKKPLVYAAGVKMCFLCRSDYAAHIPVIANLVDDRLRAAIDRVSAEIYSLQDSLGGGPVTKVHLVEGSEYVRYVCGGSGSVGVQALQSCSVAGVLQWYYEPGAVEAENTRILKRALDPSDLSAIVLAAVPEVCISSRGKTTGGTPKQSLSFAVHNTLGFVVVGLKAAGLREEEGIAQILLFSARSTHARSLDELLNVVNDGGSSVVCFSLWDTKTKSPVLPSQLSDLSTSSLTYAPVLSSASTTSRTYAQSVKVGGEVLTREAFPTRRFLLTSKLHAVPFMCPVHVEAPSRLLLGAAMRLTQELGKRAVLLELALPVSEPVLAPGQGREVHRLLSSAAASPGSRKVVLMPSPSANVAAYKVYRAFGFGESAALLPRHLNAQPDYLYPVMISACSLISRDALRRVMQRKIPSLGGIRGWHAPSTASGILGEVWQAETAKQTAKERLEKLPPLPKSKKAPVSSSASSGAFIEELALFEYVVDHISSHNTTCVAPPGLVPARTHPGLGAKRLRADSHDSFKSLPSDDEGAESFTSIVSPSPPRRKLPRRSVAGKSAPWRK